MDVAISDLPRELVKELSEEATRKVAHPLIEIIDGRGGTATLDEILIDLDRKYSQFFCDGVCAGWCRVSVVTIQPPSRIDYDFGLSQNL
jgi:hypothetical protein